MVTATKNETDLAVPAYTDYELKCKCGGLNLLYVPAIRKYFLNHWEIRFIFPFSVLTLMISSYFLYVFFFFPTIPEASFFMFCVMFLFFSLFLVSYVLCILEGPGYLPFYYPLLRPQSDTFGLSGLVTNREQLLYVKSSKYPQRTKYLKSGRRIVIRPDHFCDWVGSFIGKRNHKIFYLFNIYGVFYNSLFLYYAVQCVYWLGKSKKVTPIVALYLVYCFAALTFVVFCCMFACGLTREITINQTEIESWTNNTSYRSPDCMTNWKDVFGEKAPWWMWILPIPAFRDQSDYDLVSVDSLTPLL